MRLQFPPKLMDRPQDRYNVEHGTQNLFQQVKEMGYDVALAYGDFNTPWCQDQSLIWDTDHCFNHNLWDIYERQFGDQHERKGDD